MFDLIVAHFENRPAMAKAESEALTKVEEMFVPYRQVIAATFRAIEARR